MARAKKIVGLRPEMGGGGAPAISPDPTWNNVVYYCVEYGKARFSNNDSTTQTKYIEKV